MSARTVAVGLILVTMAVALGQAVVGAEPQVPARVAPAGTDDVPLDAAAVGPPAPWWVGWSHDINGNRIDDDLESEPWTTDARFDVFVRYAREPTDDALAAAATVADAPGRLFPLAEAVYLVGVSPLAFEALLDLPGVVAIEREERVVPTLDVASPTSMVTFSPELGNGARARWKVIGRDVTIAVLDTGIDQEHEAFDPLRFVGGYDATVPTGSLHDFVYGNLLTLDAVNALPRLNISTDAPMSEQDPDDVHSERGHGTTVAGIALGVDPNGTYHGVASGARFLDVKVISDDVDSRSDLPFGLGSTVIEGLEFVRRYNEDRTHLGDVGNDTVGVVTMSLAEGSADPGGDSTLAHAVNRLVDTGVVVVAAAGNCGPGGLQVECPGGTGNNTIAAPGSAKRAITVGAYHDGETVTWTDDVQWSRSSQGPNGGEPKPNVVAPGVNITAPVGSTADGGRATNVYENFSGTSAATPLVAGIVALMLEADPTLEPAEVKRLLMDSARDMGTPGWDPQTGAGAVRAYLAVGVALGFITLETDVLDEFGREIDERIDDVPDETNATTPPVQNLPPVVSFEVAPRELAPGEIVVFIDHSSDREGHALVAYNWDLGDGNSAKGSRIAHVYDDPGEYVVRLSVTDIEGLSGHARQTVTVWAPEGEAKESAAVSWVFAALAAVALASLARQRTRD